MSNFAPLQSRNYWTNQHQILNDWLPRWDKENCQIWLQKVLGERLPKWVKYTLFVVIVMGSFAFASMFLWTGYRPQFATDFDVLWLKRFGLAQGCAFWVSKVLKFSVRGSKSPKCGSVGKSQPKIPYFVGLFLSTACTSGKSYRNSLRMYLFVFNSPTRWCKIYAGRIYSFWDITRFATPYFADRSARSAS